MSDKKKIQITLLGRKFTLAVDEDEELVRKVAARIDEDIAVAKGNGASELSAAVFTALQLGIKEAQAQERLVGQTEKVEELISLL